MWLVVCIGHEGDGSRDEQDPLTQEVLQCPDWFRHLFSSSATKFWFGAWSLPPPGLEAGPGSSQNLLKTSPPVMIYEHTPHIPNLSHNFRGFKVPLNVVQTLSEKPWILC